MAEAISLAASITGLISAVSAITKAVQAIQNAPRLIRTVASEAKTLASIFKKLKERFEFTSGASETKQSIPYAMCEIDEILSQLQRLLGELQKELQGVMTVDGTIEDTIGLLDRVKWAAKEGDIKSVLDDLLHQKMSLLVVLQLCKTDSHPPDYALAGATNSSPSSSRGRSPATKPTTSPWLTLNLSRRSPPAASPTQIILRRSLLPCAAVRLARLVRDPHDPSKEFIDHPCGPSITDTIREQFTNIHETQRSQRAAGLRARLGPALAVVAGFREDSVAEIIARRAHSYQLPNSGAWFNTAKADPSVATWIDKVAREGGETLWFIEGFRTIVEAQVKESRAIGAWTRQKEEEDSESVGLHAREGALVVHGGFGGTGDVQEMQADAQARSFYAGDETVYAVQYRKVKVKYSRRGSSVTLDFNSRWEIMWGHMRA